MPSRRFEKAAAMHDLLSPDVVCGISSLCQTFLICLAPGGAPDTPRLAISGVSLRIFIAPLMHLIGWLMAVDRRKKMTLAKALGAKCSAKLSVTSRACSRTFIRIFEIVASTSVLMRLFKGCSRDGRFILNQVPS